MGRPSTLTPEVHEKLVQHLQSGAFVEMAAALEGVPVDSVKEWLRRGKASIKTGRDSEEVEIPYANFSRAVDNAIAGYNKNALSAIAAAGKKDWKALAWILRSRSPALFGTSSGGTGVEVTTTEGKDEDGERTTTTTIKVQTSNEDDDLFAEAGEFILKRRRERALPPDED